MGQAIAKVIGNARRKDLRLVLQAAERTRVDNTVAVALKRVAVWMARLRVAAPARRFNRESQVREHQGGCYFCGRSFSAERAIWLTSDFSPATCRSSFRASSGRVGPMPLAYVMVAWFFDTRSVGWSISSFSRVSASLERFAAKSICASASFGSEA